MVNLVLEICGLKLRNPVMPAAGPATRDGDALIAAAQNGAGALVANTVTRVPARPPYPYMLKVREGLLSAEFSSDLPLEQWLRVEYPKAKRAGLTLIANIGYTLEDVSEIAPKIAEAGIDALELSARYVKNPKSIAEMTKAVKEAVSIPVFVKLNPNVPNISDFAHAAEMAGADGMVAIDAIGPCLTIDIENTMPMLGSSFGQGWLSGPAIKPVALRCVADLCRSVRVPVVGAGGIWDGRDAVEFIMAGASAVQVGTAAIIRGPKIYGIIVDEIARLMRAKGYDSIEDMRGVGLRHLSEHPRMTTRPLELFVSKCTGCGLCVGYCIYGAIRMVGKIAKLDPVKCQSCGLCVSVCPTRAIRF